MKADRVVAAALAATLLLTSCVVENQMGPRPGPDPVASVEAYLQRYQPGPTPRLFQTTRFYDRQDTLLAERFDEGRGTWVPLQHVSKSLIDATISGKLWALMARLTLARM